jgi:hypothetical protein
MEPKKPDVWTALMQAGCALMLLPGLIIFLILCVVFLFGGGD